MIFRRLDSNALICDCQLMWLANMVKEKEGHTQVAATCEFPSVLQGKSLTSLTDEEFQCRGNLFKFIIFLILLDTRVLKDRRLRGE